MDEKTRGAPSDRIPLCDLKAQYASIRDELLPVVEEVLASTNYIGGPYVDSFEKDFVRLHEATAGVGCANGTAAIRLALETLGVGDGDEVITTPHTFIATVEAIMHAGAKPVFVDIDAKSFNIDPTKVAAAVTAKTRAILPVHLYGNPCNLDAIWQIATAHKLHVIEDCAQAHFARYQGKLVGTQSDAATFSFYPGKNLGAAGDAGFVLARSRDVVEKMRALANHGRGAKEKYRHDLVGYNDRIDALQSAILSVKLKHILAWSKRRSELGKNYDLRLRERGFKTIDVLPGSECVYHQYVVEMSNRDEVLAALAEKGISAQIHYPIPLHKQPAFAAQFAGQSFPVTERAAERILSLPIYPEITAAQVERVVTEFLSVAKP